MTTILDTQIASIKYTDEWVRVCYFDLDKQAHVRATLANHGEAVADVEIAVAPNNSNPGPKWARDGKKALGIGETFYPAALLLQAGESLYARSTQSGINVSSDATLEVVQEVTETFSQIFHISEAGFESSPSVIKSGSPPKWEAYENFDKVAEYAVASPTHNFPEGRGNYWRLVLLDNDPQTVSAITFSDCGLIGQLPSITEYPALDGFYVQNNELTGRAPDISKNAVIRNCSYSSNKISGTIPDLSANTSLQGYFCGNNEITGEIPDLSGLINLSSFYCNNNQLTGTLPSFVGLASLKRFYCYENSLIGPLPSFGNTPLLTHFWASGNALTGGIPNLNNSPDLQYLYLDNNSLTGAIPSLASNPSLILLHVHNNNLVGNVPDLSVPLNLDQLYADGNGLTGLASGFDVPTQSFSRIFLSDNALSQASIDQLYQVLNASGVVGGSANTFGGSNADPANGPANTDVVALQGRGWTITL